MISAAKRRLAQLEQQNLLQGPQADMFASAQTEAEPPVHAAVAELEGLEPDELTPKQALEALYKLKGMVR